MAEDHAALACLRLSTAEDALKWGNPLEATACAAIGILHALLALMEREAGDAQDNAVG